jgi:hypothetical protein
MSSDLNPKTILLKGDPIAGEGTAGGVITPGMVVAVAGSVVTAAAANARAAIFAREFELTGRGIDDDYAADDRVLYYHARPGDQFYALLAENEDVDAGDLLAAGATGTLVEADAGDGAATPVEFPANVLCKALEAVDNDSDPDGPVRIKVEVV